jgi:hypothetical protein
MPSRSAGFSRIHEIVNRGSPTPALSSKESEDHWPRGERSPSSVHQKTIETLIVAMFENRSF